MNTIESPQKNMQTLLEKKKGFEKVTQVYLENNTLTKNNNRQNELEIRFGTNPRISTPISKLDYDNVIKYLYSNGFKIENTDGVQMLRIQNEYTDLRTGRAKMSNTRAEITGSYMIQEYCRTNSIQKLIDKPNTIDDKIKFTQKYFAEINGTRINKIDFEDFNFRVSYQTEQDFNVHSNMARNIISKWDNSLKIFRCMNRIRFYHDEYPIFADLSIVKSSKKMNKIPIPKYTIQDAEVFNNIEHYEIELEVDNSKVGVGTKYNNSDNLLTAIRKCIRIILSGLQNTNYPISYQIQNDLHQSYLKVIYQDNYTSRKINPKDFLGPSSYTLQLENIIDEVENKSNIPNIRTDYTVTDKADGDRTLLYVSNDGNLYLIDTNMKIMFTGSKTQETTLCNSILDGEHITKNKLGNNINLFMAFDIYYLNNESTREYAFYPKDNEDTKIKYRLKLLYQYINNLKPVSVVANKIDNVFQIKCKEFYISTTDNTEETNNKTIFNVCNEILTKVHDESYEYNTDGLIFTPAYISVGGNKEDDKPGPLKKYTWPLSFKWKPAEFNTIDFLVTTKKDKNNNDEIHTIFKSGTNLTRDTNIIEYKSLILRCGFDSIKHAFINPCQSIIDDIAVDNKFMDNNDTYQPVPFQPTEPYDKNAHICNIQLQKKGTHLYMLTEDNDNFEDNMIVEFRYDHSKDDKWKWIPIRVRYDKTAQLRNGIKNYGNSYHVANSNWYSIHNPITNNMITTGLNIPNIVNSDEIYYDRGNDETNTKSLRHFHNLYVKSKLITGVSNHNDILIDYAVGKAGDLAKWTHNNLDFVLGIDISKDNIHNKLDGACTRYLKEKKKKYNKFPKALFVVGNSELNIRKGDAFNSEKDKLIVDAIFGVGPKDSSIIGQAVYNNYGIANNGFNISSCQFALHYFFENKKTLLSFIKNIVECTKLNGHFIGTCYDGNIIFDKLKKLNNGEHITINKNDTKIYEITKLYNQTGFPDDELSLGYPINVYQESINKVFREYLVNFNYLINLMEDYGFVVITSEEAKQMGFPSGTGLFNELYSEMINDISINPKISSNYKTAMNMSEEEKQISFMNRYFIFKKVRNVNTNIINDIHLNKEIIEEIEDEKDDEKDDEKEIINKPIPTKRKLKLTNFTPPSD